MSSNATMNSLPPEVKIHIASELDRWDRLRTVAPTTTWIQYRKEAVWTRRDLADLELGRTAIGAMFQVSKEWNEITAAFRFRTLTAGQCANPVDRLALHGKYGQRVRVLDLAESDCESLTALPAVLPSLHSSLHVKEVRLPSFKYSLMLLNSGSLAANDRNSSRWCEALEAALRPILQGAVVVHLDGIASSLYSIGLSLGASVRKLHIGLNPQFPDAFGNLLGLIPACHALVELEAMQLGTSVCTPFVEAEQSQYLAKSWPAVRRLAVVHWHHAANLHFLESLLAPTLVFLDVTCWHRGRDNMYVTSATVHPALKTLVLRGHQSATTRPVSEVSPARFPALRTLSWETSLPNIGRLSRDTQQPLDGLIARFAFAVAPLDIELLEDPRSPLLRAGFQAQLGLPPNVRIVPNTRAELPPYPRRTFALPQFVENETTLLDHALEEIHALLDEMRGMADMAAMTEDRVQVARIAQSLQECEWLRQNMRM